MYKELLTKFGEKSFKRLLFFFGKYNLLTTGTRKFVVIIQKLTLFQINLFGNFCSTLPNLSDGIKNVTIVRLKKKPENQNQNMVSLKVLHKSGACNFSTTMNL